MSVKIRLARGGSKKRPVHKIVVAESRARRDGRFIESIGYYNPLLPKENPEALVIKEDSAKKWMSQGAELTERVQKLFALRGLCAKVVYPAQPKKSAPKAKAQERLKEIADKAAAAEEAKRQAEEAAKAAAAAPVEEVVVEETPAETPVEETTETPAQ